jgi:excisionase family DNA binding protein
MHRYQNLRKGGAMPQTSAPRTPPDELEDRLLTIPEVAGFLACGRTHVYGLIRDGALPSIKWGDKRVGNRRVRLSAVRKFVADLENAQTL